MTQNTSIHGPFEPTWESLKQVQVPDWYINGKFGIFIHWGVYSVPAFGNEWYPRNMYPRRIRLNLNITSRPMGRTPSLVIKTLSRS